MKSQNLNQNQLKHLTYMENMNNQGKRPDQYTNSTKFAGYSIVGMIVLLILITLLGGCATKHETTDKCCGTEETSTE